MADLPLNSTPTAVMPVSKPTPASKPQHRDSIRETFETIVFVVALVLMLKLFVVEAFVIPTGSMAETLLGYNKEATCPECAYRFPVNSSNEVEPPDGMRVVVDGACCPNCRHRFTWNPADGPNYRSGDRVLVHKALYHFEPPERGDVVVFKFPVDPQVKQTAQNYIKRLWGLGGETIGINRGDLYRSTALTYNPDAVYPDADPVPESFRGKKKYPRPDNTAHVWERGPNVGFPVSKTSPPYDPVGPDYTYHNADEALELFETSRKADFAGGAAGFELIRKPDALVMSMRRIVYDNDHQSKTAVSLGLPPRWSAESNNGWTPNDPNAPRVFAHAGDQLSWVRYQHRNIDPNSPEVAEKIRNGAKAAAFPPTVVTNFMGYNSAIDAPLDRFGRVANDPERGPMIQRGNRETTEYWVGDLILECSASFQTADAQLVLELSKGRHRYQAVFAEGKVRLVRTGPQGKELATRPTPITGSGIYSLRFANVDCRLRVWVNDTRIDFGTDADYPPDEVPDQFDAADRMQEGWTLTNDVLAPASVGAKGGVQVSKLVVWRDSYFTPYGDGHSKESEIAKYVDTFYVHPSHYMCLGDNSAQSSDSRTWGTVPDRLMLGKAVFVFFPVNRIGLIR
jgi:signal peptidase I